MSVLSQLTKMSLLLLILMVGPGMVIAAGRLRSPGLETDSSTIIKGAVDLKALSNTPASQWGHAHHLFAALESGARTFVVNDEQTKEDVRQWNLTSYEDMMRHAFYRAR